MRRKNMKKYDEEWPIVAICYDFDKTLSPKDMQEFGLIPKLNCSSKEFWDQSNGMAKKEGMDKILAYMLTILKKAGHDISITEKDFNNLGKEIELFPGVDTWFDRINKIAEEAHVKVEHYIISAGLKEIIQGTSIARFFKGIYASTFLYEASGKAYWPRQVVNYTTKTQYLFRINKDCLDLSDEDSVNEYKEDEERRIPFTNFIYIGDSETDIPAMKIVKNGGGIAIGVYNPETKNMDKVMPLLKQKRIDFLMPADYSENSRIEQLVRTSLKKIAESNTLTILNRQQKRYVKHLEHVREFIIYIDDFIDTEKMSKDDIKSIKAQSRTIMRRMRKALHSSYDNISSPEEIDAYVDHIEVELRGVFEKKNKEIKEKQTRQLSTGEIQDESNDQSEN
jgi:hypothetical protein